MESRRQKAAEEADRVATELVSRLTARDPLISAEQWIELSRKLLQKARSGFSANELVTINGFINYVAPDVEAIQQPEKA